MKSIKLLIKENGFKVLKILMEEWYVTECIANNSSEVDDINIIKHPNLVKYINEFIYFYKNNLREYDIRFLEMSLKELERKNIPYCYVLEENNKIYSVVENHTSIEQINEIYMSENSLEMEI